MSEQEEKYIVNTILNFYPELLDKDEVIRLLTNLEKQKIITFNDAIK